MIRHALPALALFTLGLIGIDPVTAQAQTWTVTKVERTDMGLVTETKLNLMSGLTETKQLLVLGKKNEFLQFSLTIRPDKKGALPTAMDFKVVDADGMQVGKQTSFLKGKNNNVTMVFQGDWAKLDGLKLEGPGPRSHPLGKAVPKK